MNIESLKEKGTIAVFVIEAEDKHTGEETYWCNKKGWVKEVDDAKDYKSRKIAESAMAKIFPVNSYEQSIKRIRVMELII